MNAVLIPMLDEISKSLIKIAIAEDLGSGDITSQATISETATSTCDVIAKDAFVLCGQQVSSLVFTEVDSGIEYETLAFDGARVHAGEVLARVKGSTRSILAAERTALNFLQHLSAIATKTARVVGLVEDSDVRILDTRKTTPGWRSLEKYAVSVGGGVNHRMGLFDAILIKNNHVDACSGDIGLSLRSCFDFVQAGTKVEVEVRNEEELKAALAECPDAILLDNMSVEELERAVAIVRAAPEGKTIELEASGGITEENVAFIARSGINSISLGALTHSVQAVDIALHYRDV